VATQKQKQGMAQALKKLQAELANLRKRFEDAQAQAAVGLPPMEANEKLVHASNSEKQKGPAG